MKLRFTCGDFCDRLRQKVQKLSRINNFINKNTSARQIAFLNMFNIFIYFVSNDFYRENLCKGTCVSEKRKKL